MKSMTGFGRSDVQNKEFGVTFAVELISTNRKQLEIRPLLARELSSFEPLLRKLISARIYRGSISARINIEIHASSSLISKTVKINSALAESLTKRSIALKEELNLPGEVSITDIMAIPGVIETSSPDLSIPELENSFVEAVNSAIANFDSMRQEEGNHIKEDLSERIKHLKSLLKKIVPLAQEIPKLQKEKLLERLASQDIILDCNDDRFLKEVVIFTDKSDVSEEITRLESHFKQFFSFLERDDEPVGRSLEFLIQELFREITTLGNKALSSDISHLIVNFKTEIEKIREQVQNIE